MGIFILVVAAVFSIDAVVIEAGQASPDTKNIFSSIEEKNGL